MEEIVYVCVIELINCCYDSTTDIYISENEGDLSRHCMLGMLICMDV
jgi:hypothetical protein